MAGSVCECGGVYFCVQVCNIYSFGWLCPSYSCVSAAGHAHVHTCVIFAQLVMQDVGVCVKLEFAMRLVACSIPLIDVILYSHSSP